MAMMDLTAFELLRLPVSSLLPVAGPARPGSVSNDLKPGLASCSGKEIRPKAAFFSFQT